eukprot:CAMPEP_0172494048 /NCGR_PEP_ID=MMETSP1066-20121228/37136_1 /TAXON_ID=671091 /ORGANISM="Coscinodiscus wailesii, Strain CCMP2513" /LENGTH=91 /DNA_ID=CAMNT_0013264673 /DNA_START=115 /DNA_END=390 /DNA_ORIENTATION=+
MIINAQFVVIVSIIISAAFVVGLKLIRSFALSIAQENHDANVAMDNAEESLRQKRERDADAAAASAFARVEPLLPVSASSASAPESGGAQT